MKTIRISLMLVAASILLQAQPTERTMNFTVRDKKGIQVKTLSAADLEFTDDGKPTTPRLTLFDGTDLIEAGQRKPAEPIRRIRLIPIVFEGLNNEQRRLAKQIANDLIKEDKDLTHLFGVFKISNQLSVLQPFTSNRDDIRKAIDLATSGVANVKFAEVNKEVVGKLKLASTTNQALTDADVSPANLGNSAALQGLLARTQLAMLSDTIIDDAEGSRRTLAFFDALTFGLRAFPGRKSIAYINAGLYIPTFLDVPFESMLARANLAGVSIYPFDTRGIDTNSQATFVNSVIDSNAANTDAGVENREVGDNTNRINNVVEGMRLNFQAKQITMAESTGAFNAIESNDPKKQIRELIADTTSYYELAYDPKISDYNGLFRRTEIKLKQPELRVRGREGYLAMPPGQENLLPYELPLLKALNAMPVVRDVEFRSGAWKMKSTKELINGMVAVEVPFENLAFAQDEVKGLYAARISLITQVRDPQGKVIEKFTRDLPLKGKLDQLAALKTSNFNFRERFAVPPGRYVIETAVIDQLSRKIGARKTSFLAAPTNAPLAMSSVTVVRSYQPGAKDLAPEDPFQFQGGRITPTLNNTLKALKGAQMALFFVVYPEVGAAAAPQAIVQYFKDGEVAGSANLQLPAADAQGRISYVLSSPLDAMPPGNYEVKIVIKQGTAAVAESVFLTVGA